MLDLQFIRDNPEKIKESVRNKNLNPDVVDEVLRLDQERRTLIVQSQDLRAKRNTLNESLKVERTAELIEESKRLKLDLENIEPTLKQVEEQLASLLLQVPNVVLDEVPVGTDASGNQQVKVWGEKPTFDFQPQEHMVLGERLGILDLERGSKVSGFRGYYLKNQAVMLQFGLMRYALEKLQQHGFSPIIPPVVNRRRAFVNTGHFPWGESETYAIMPDDPQTPPDTFLAGTAEIPLVSFHADETVNESDLPITYAGVSPCYRREIGNYGKDTKGIYRVHEFMKVEQVVLCAADVEESRRWHENLLSYAEEMLQELQLHYRVMLMCTGDMGEPQMKKYDIETWMPGRNDFGETMSDSIMGDFQSRRANIRYRAKDGTLKYVHMLNNTALASTRMIIAILENYQQADGSVKIPDVLVPYVGFSEIR